MVFHTHWDREWYLPFAVYRQRLLKLIDSLIVALAGEPDLRFHLDGQMALIDDYLELRPERTNALRQAAAAGRISLGPWYTLPDEHLVSGETLIRNLELGIARARQLGRPLMVGYLPDQFGHTAQMPSILRHVGIEHAVLWRGVPAAVGTTVFTWEALDGTAVTAVHLRHGYCDALDLPISRVELGAHLARLVDEQRERNPTGPWLVMSGNDHQPVPVGVAAALGSAAASRAAASSSIEDFVAVQPAPGSRWRGELLSGATSNVLKGTLSARLPLKLRHAALERRLERYLEPVFALSYLPWPATELGYCWRQVILNSAHDSICGCSVDQVHEQASQRLDRGQSLCDLLWERLGRGSGLFNPSLFERDGVPALGVAGADPTEDRPARPLELQLEDCPDAGDEYTFDPPPGAEAVRRPLTAGLFTQRAGEPFTRVTVEVDNQTPDHRLRLLVPTDTSGGAWTGVAFGAVHRPFRRPGTEEGVEYDLRTDPARLWVESGGVAVFVAGPFEYELVDGAIAVTLLRSVGWLSKPRLRNRPIAAGPTIATPAAQVPGRHDIELAVYHHDGDWRQARVPRWAEVFAHPLVPAPAVPLRRGPEESDPAVMLSALRRLGGRRQLRIYRCDDPWRIEERWLD